MNRCVLLVIVWFVVGLLLNGAAWLFAQAQAGIDVQDRLFWGMLLVCFAFELVLEAPGFFEWDNDGDPEDDTDTVIVGR